MVTVIGIDPSTKATGVCILTKKSNSFRINIHLNQIERVPDTEPNFTVSFHSLQVEGETPQDRFPGMVNQIWDIFNGYVMDLAVIEFQQIRPGDPRPNNILDLQSVAAAAAGCARARGLIPSRIYTPLPIKWKGSVPKDIHQERILLQAPWAREALSTIPRGVRSDCIDALGLALWGLNQTRYSAA